MKDLGRLIFYTSILGLLAYKIPDVEKIIPVETNPINVPYSIESSRGVPIEREIRSNADIVYWYLSDKGMNPIQIYAIMGNIQQESNFDNGCIESNGIGFGLIQWSFERRTQLFNELDNPYDIYQQLDFFYKELDYQWTGNYKEVFYNTTDLTEATIAFCNGFERAGIPMMNNRIAFAEYFQSYYEGGER